MLLRQLEPPRRDARHAEQTLDQARETSRAAQRGDRRALALLRLLHRLELEEQRGQGRTELVRRDGEELVAQAQGLLRLDEAQPLLFGLLALGEVAHDLGEAAQLAVLVADGGQDRVRPELRAVLADP